MLKPAGRLAARLVCASPPTCCSACAAPPSRSECAAPRVLAALLPFLHALTRPLLIPLLESLRVGSRHRAINFTARYERLASRMLSERFVRGDSLIYGLGVPFMAYRGRVECYTRAGVAAPRGSNSHLLTQRAGLAA